MGKELVARCIHELGTPDGPFVPVNASAIPKDLQEAELFVITSYSIHYTKLYDALVAEQPVGPEEWKAEKDSFIQGLAERKRLAAVDAFLAERMKQAKLTINPEALK